MPTICQHFHVVKFPKQCNVSSSAKRPAYAQLKVLVCTMRFVETQVLGTSFYTEIKTYVQAHSNYIL